MGRYKSNRFRKSSIINKGISLKENLYYFYALEYYLGNIVQLWEKLAEEKDLIVDLGSD